MVLLKLANGFAMTAYIFMITTWCKPSITGDLFVLTSSFCQIQIVLLLVKVASDLILSS